MLELKKENDALRLSKQQLERRVAASDAAVANLTRQVAHLTEFNTDRPVDLFAPVTIEITGLSRGASYDGKPGDDGVTVYLRPKDSVGHVVKVPGRVTIQLIDNSDLANPIVLGPFVFDDPVELGNLWLERFSTRHFKLKCPFPPGTVLPRSRRITVSAEFVDFLTGRTLTAVKEVPVSFPDEPTGP